MGKNPTKSRNPLILSIPDVIYNNLFKAKDPSLKSLSTVAIPTTLGMSNDRRRLLQFSLKVQKPSQTDLDFVNNLSSNSYWKLFLKLDLDKTLFYQIEEVCS